MSGGPKRARGMATASLTLAGLLLAAACTAPAYTAAGETAVARDTLGPTVVVLPQTAVGNTTTQTAAATVQTPLPAAPSATPTAPASAIPSEAALTVEACEDQACAAETGHLWLARPIAAEAGYVNFVERSYPYGSTQGGLRETHHGVEFANPSGTPVLAAGAGVVVVAGADAAEAYGPRPNFYGNLVVIEHDQTHDGQPVYTLYGHLRSVAVSAGARVEAGDLLGQVGSTGVAIGAHLHFEVRVGANDYASTRNPELWLLPLPYNGAPQGVIAGRVLDPEGNWLPEVTVVIRPLSTESDRPRNRFVQTYHDDDLLNADERLEENFAIGDVPRGLYSVAVNTTRLYEQQVTVKTGEVAWVTFVVNPPQITPTSAASETPAEGTAAAETPSVETPAAYPPQAETPTPADVTPTVEPAPTLEATPEPPTATP